jgi:hypothetical protein
MEIEIVENSEEFFDNNYKSFFSVTVDGVLEMNFMDGEPEDNNLYRNFSDICAIPALLQKVYNAGKNKEEFSINMIER